MCSVSDRAVLGDEVIIVVRPQSFMFKKFKDERRSFELIPPSIVLGQDLLVGLTHFSLPGTNPGHQTSTSIKDSFRMTSLFSTTSIFGGDK